MQDEIEVQMPAVDFLVESHHESAESAIASMSPSRRYGAEADQKSWRRVLTEINPTGKDGYAFVGHLVRVGERATLPIGSLVVAVDTSWAKAHWYARGYVRPLERAATLLRVTDAGLVELLRTDSRNWAQEILGYLMTNRDLLVQAGVAVKGEAASRSAAGPATLRPRSRLLGGKRV